MTVSSEHMEKSLCARLTLYKDALNLAVDAYIGKLDSWEHEQHAYAAKKKGRTIQEDVIDDFLKEARSVNAKPSK